MSLFRLRLYSSFETTMQHSLCGTRLTGVLRGWMSFSDITYYSDHVIDNTIIINKIQKFYGDLQAPINRNGPLYYIWVCPHCKAFLGGTAIDRNLVGPKLIASIKRC